MQNKYWQLWSFVRKIIRWYWKDLQKSLQKDQNFSKRNEKWLPKLKIVKYQSKYCPQNQLIVLKPYSKKKMIFISNVVWFIRPQFIYILLLNFKKNENKNYLFFKAFINKVKKWLLNKHKDVFIKRFDL